LIHDNRLTELYAWLRGPERFAEMVSRSLGRPVAVEETEEWQLDIHRPPVPCFDEVVSKAEPLLVHARAIQARVRRLYGRPAVRLPFCCTRPFAADELTPASRRAARAHLGVPEGRVLILSAGVVSPARGPLECLWAVEQLRAWGVPAELHFAGPAPFLAEALRLWVGRLRLAEHVRVLDEWLPESTYRGYLLGADLALQLKAPGFAAPSASAADCLSAGLPAVMNESLAEVMEARDCVTVVPDHSSPVLVAERLLEVIEAGRWRDRTGPARAEYVAAHSFERYADALLRALAVA
jgi:glycosyltransferase involved in cell wall biosynthesis